MHDLEKQVTARATSLRRNIETGAVPQSGDGAALRKRKKQRMKRQRKRREKAERKEGQPGGAGEPVPRTKPSKQARRQYFLDMNIKKRS